MWKDSKRYLHVLNNVCIISGGDVNSEFLCSFLRENPCDRILCVDGGLAYAYEAGIPVDEIVGDFDTVSIDILEYYRNHSNVHIRSFDPIKDNTDTDIALTLALQWKPKSIYVFGAMGSRMDHTLGNIHILMKTLRTDTKTYLINENNRISMIDGPIQIEKEKQYGTYISFIPFTEKIENLSLKGFKYPLEDRTMVFGESLGISNEIISKTAEVTFSRGILLVIETKD